MHSGSASKSADTKGWRRIAAATEYAGWSGGYYRAPAPSSYSVERGDETVTIGNGCMKVLQRLTSGLSVEHPRRCGVTVPSCALQPSSPETGIPAVRVPVSTAWAAGWYAAIAVALVAGSVAVYG